jgi:hypothetical protein
MRKNLAAHTPRLSARDLVILKEVWRYGFRSYDELFDLVLNQYSRSWTWKIMKRLVRLGYLHERRNEMGNIHGWAGVAAPTAPDFIKTIRSEISKRKSPKYSSSFLHDKEVRELLDQFRMISFTRTIRTEPELRAEVLSKIQGYSRRELSEINSQIPDASVVLEIGTDQLKVALEMELNQKNNLRLRKKLERYSAKSGYDFVLYFCANQTIFEALMRNYRFILANSPSIKFAIKKTPIYFTLYDECKGNLLDALFVSVHDEFKLRKFSK